MFLVLDQMHISSCNYGQISQIPQKYFSCFVVSKAINFDLFATAWTWWNHENQKQQSAYERLEKKLENNIKEQYLSKWFNSHELRVKR